MDYFAIWYDQFLGVSYSKIFSQVAGFTDSPVSDAHVPYILDVLPVLQVSGGGPQQFMRQVMPRWGTAKKPHFVADSAFGSIEMLTEVKGWGGGGTLACSPTVNSYLWEAIKVWKMCYQLRNFH